MQECSKISDCKFHRFHKSNEFFVLFQVKIEFSFFNGKYFGRKCNTLESFWIWPCMSTKYLTEPTSFFKMTNLHLNLVQTFSIFTAVIQSMALNQNSYLLTFLAKSVFASIPDEFNVWEIEFIEMCMTSHKHTQAYTGNFSHPCINTYLYVAIWVCVYAREREREREMNMWFYA